jgi:hypothetical protein
MSDDFGAVYVDTRRQLRGVAETLIAGPQYRSAGTIRLAVRPDGFAATAIPLAVHGSQLVWPNGATALAGRLQEVADAAGVDPGPPDGVYEIVDPLPTDTALHIDALAADWIYRCHYAGGHAIKSVFPDAHPVLWPEHFDVGIAVDDVNYGVSPGDVYSAYPYAYVGPWQPRVGGFWNADFGAARPMAQLPDVTAVVDFFREGAEHARSDPPRRP